MIAKLRSIFVKWFRSEKTHNSHAEGMPLSPFGEVVYAIGDIHGRLDLLVELVDKITLDFEKMRDSSSFDLAARLVFLGDYVDRGPNSSKVIDFLIALEVKGFKFVFLKGNHEQVLMEVLEKPARFRSWLTHGGDETVRSYDVDIDMSSSDVALEQQRVIFRDALPITHKKFLQNLKLYYHRSPLFFVHAGVNPKLPLDEQDEETCLWIREEFLQSRKKLPSVIVHGHTPQTLPSWDGRRIGLDTGAYFTNKLVSAKIYGNAVDFLST